MDNTQCTPEQVRAAIEDMARKNIRPMTSEEINRLIYAEMEGTCEAFPRPDPRPDVVALFTDVLGDNTAHESVQRLIDGVIALIHKREGY